MVITDPNTGRSSFSSNGAILTLLVLVFFVQGRGSSFNYASHNKPVILKAWQNRIHKNGGVHEWTSQHAGQRVFQEWITLLEIHRNAPLRQKKALGERLERYVVNENMRALSIVGTSLPLPGSPRADFDMSLLSCISLLGLFEGDSILLTNNTYVHLLKNVVRLWGQEPKHYFDVLLLSFQETENHVFMIETTRYLTNQFIYENRRQLGKITQLADSLKARGVILHNKKGPIYVLLLKQMHQILKSGFFEFNSKVYQRFTLHALDNVYTFSSDSLIKTAAQCVLDYTSIKFAFQSYQSVRLGPYRRNAQFFQEKSLLGSDAIASFFGIQTGDVPLNSDNLLQFWEESARHSSIALFSTVLNYRVPSMVLDIIQNRQCCYEAVMETKHQVNGRLETTPEIYFIAPGFIVSAGGRYKFYQGANFPVTIGDAFLNDAPWVYDIISRSSSAFFRVDTLGGRLVETNLLEFSGPQWKENNTAVYRNFMYGYKATADYSSSEWPLVVPSTWQLLADVPFENKWLEGRLLDVPDMGVYIILTRLKQGNSWFKFDYQKYARGTAEIIDTAWVSSFNALESYVKGWVHTADKNVYTMVSGENIGLNPKYSRKKNGITYIQKLQRNYGSEKLVYGSFKPYSKQNLPLMCVKRIYMGSPDADTICEADGRGNVYFYTPGDTLKLNFENWWNPRRYITHPDNDVLPAWDSVDMGLRVK